MTVATATVTTTTATSSTATTTATTSTATSTTAGTAATLAADRVSVARGRRWILRDVTLEARAGRILAVRGGPHAGKTTLLSVLSGLLAPTSGEVTYGGRRVRAGSTEHRRRTGMVLQGYGLVPHLTVAENVELAVRMHGVDPAEARVRAWNGLERLGLAGLAGRTIGALVSGQQQRVAVARALAAEPAVLVADEPTSRLEAGSHRDLVVGGLRAAADAGAVVVVATRDPAMEAAADTVVAL